MPSERRKRPVRRSAVRHEQAANPTPTQTTDVGTAGHPVQTQPDTDAEQGRDERRHQSPDRVERIRQATASATWAHATAIDSPALHPDRWPTLAKQQDARASEHDGQKDLDRSDRRRVVLDGRDSQGGAGSNSGNPSTDPPWTRSMTSVMNRPLPRIQPEPACSVRRLRDTGQPLERLWRGHPQAQGLVTGRLFQPRMCEMSSSALVQSTSQSGKRFRTSSRATRPSRRARAAPRQK